MTSRIVDFGVPSTKFQQWESKSKSNNNNEWEKTEVRFHDFANISEREISPEFPCLGSNWRLMLIVGEQPGFIGKADPGCVGLFLQNTSNTSNTSISIDFRFTIKNSKNKVLRRLKPRNIRDADGKRVDNVTFTNEQPYWGIYNFGIHFFMKHFYLVKGALRVEVKMKLIESNQLTNELESLPSSGEDCPICMEPISKPWGVVTPCGHPFHQSCWYQVVAKHSESDEDDDAQLSCAVCRKVATGFQLVYLDLGCGGANAADSRSSDLEDVVEGGNDDDQVEYQQLPLTQTPANSNVVEVDNNNADMEANGVIISAPPSPPYPPTPDSIPPPPESIDLDDLSLPSLPSFSSVPMMNEIRTERVVVESRMTGNRLLRWARRPLWTSNRRLLPAFLRHRS